MITAVTPTTESLAGIQSIYSLPPQAHTVVSVRRVVPSSDVSTDTTDIAPSGSSSMVYVSSTIWPGSCILGIVLYKRWLWSWEEQEHKVISTTDTEPEEEILHPKEPQYPLAQEGVLTKHAPSPLSQGGHIRNTSSPQPARSPHNPIQQGGCPQLHSSHLWSVELQIWELLSFQVSITQETAVLKCISPLQACYPTTPLSLPGLQLSPLSCQPQVPSWLRQP